MKFLDYKNYYSDVVEYFHPSGELSTDSILTPHHAPEINFETKCWEYRMVVTIHSNTPPDFYVKLLFTIGLRLEGDYIHINISHRNQSENYLTDPKSVNLDKFNNFIYSQIKAHIESLDLSNFEVRGNNPSEIYIINKKLGSK